MPVASSLYSGNNPPLYYGVYTAAGVTLIDGTACAFQFDINGNLKTTGSGGGGGGGTVTQGPGLGTAASFWTVQLTNGTNYLGTTPHPLIIDVAGVGVQPISATTLPLPTNAAQETGGNLATLAGTVSSSKVGVAQTGLPSDNTATGTINANAANVAIATNGTSGIVFNVTGTWVGTLQPQYQLPDSSWVNGSVFPTLPSGASVSTVTANGQWKTQVGGFKGFRLLSTAWSSGTATINLEGSQFSTFESVLVKGSSGNALDGTAGSPSTGVVTVQGVGGGTAIPTSAASLPLPANASQETGGNLAAIANAVALPGAAAANNVQLTFGPQIQTLSAWTSSTTTQNITPSTGCCALIVQLDQNSSITGGAVTWQGTYDGVNWSTIPAVQIADPTSGSIASIANPYTLQASTNKPFYIMLYGYQQVRANLTTPITGAGASVTPYVSQLSYYIQMNPASAPPPINYARYGGSTVVAAASGIAKVGISGNGAATLDAVITAATAPANALATLHVNTTTAPSLTNGQSVAAQCDYVGSLYTKNCRRSQTTGQATTIASTTSATTVVSAAAAGIFADIATLIITVAPIATTAIAFTATLSDGTTSYIFDMDTGVIASGGADPLLLNFNPPLPATSSATAWTLALSVSTVTVHVTAVSILQKAS